jgi:hypothetical protein
MKEVRVLVEEEFHSLAVVVFQNLKNQWLLAGEE